MYENKAYLPEGPFSRKRSTKPEVLTEVGLRALSSFDNTRIVSKDNCKADFMKVSLEDEINKINQSSSVRPLIIAKDSSFEQEIENYKSISKCSNYDTVAEPIARHRSNSNPFKAKPGSISFCNPSSISPIVDSNEQNKRSITKSNVFLRAARSITKTKSVSGNFIVKTTICKSMAKAPTCEKDASIDNSGTSMPSISK